MSIFLFLTPSSFLLSTVSKYVSIETSYKRKGYKALKCGIYTGFTIWRSIQVAIYLPLFLRNSVYCVCDAGYEAMNLLLAEHKHELEFLFPLG